MEFLTAVTRIDVNALSKEGQPVNVADLGHVAGFCYELCRFVQVSREFCDQLVVEATRTPQELDRQIEPLRKLIASIADGRDYQVKLQEGTEVQVFGSQLERNAYIPPPVMFWSPKFEQALMLTAIYYLGHMDDASLIRRCREADCQKLFVAARRSRVFCSHECASAASMRTYKKRQQSKGV